MKKSFFKILLSVLLCVTMFGAVIMTSACNTKPDNSSQITDSSVSSGDSSASGPAGNAEVVDRSNYTAADASESVMKSNAYDFFMSFSGETDNPLKDYMIGDFINMAAESLAKELNSGFDFESILSEFDFSEFDFGDGEGEFDFDLDELKDLFGSIFSGDLFPQGTNVNAFSYTYYSDGFWRDNLNNVKVHRILNIILCYKPFGNEPIEFSAQDIETYGDVTVIEILGYKDNDVMKAILCANAVSTAVMNATVNEIADLFSKEAEKTLDAFSGIFGGLSVKDLSDALSIDLGEYEETLAELTVNDIMAAIANLDEEQVQAFVSVQIGLLVSYLIENYGDEVIVNDITLNDLFTALLEAEPAEEGEEIDYLSVLLDVFGDVKLSEIAEQYGFEVDEEDAEKTVSEIYEMISEKIASQAEESNPEAAAIDEAFGYISENYGEIVIIDDITVADLIAALEAAEDVEEGESPDYLGAVVELFGEYSIADFFETFDVAVPEEYASYFETTVSELIDMIVGEIDKIISEGPEEYIGEIYEEYGETVIDPVAEYLKTVTVEELITNVVMMASSMQAPSYSIGQ